MLRLRSSHVGGTNSMTVCGTSSSASSMKVDILMKHCKWRTRLTISIVLYLMSTVIISRYSLTEI